MTGRTKRKAKVKPSTEISSALDAVRAAVVEGDNIIAKARADFGFSEVVDDGPQMTAFKQRDPEQSETSTSALNDALAELIGHIVTAERTGRWIAASAGLARLRERYEEFDTRDLPSDERNWVSFAAKHVPLPVERVAEMIGKMVHSSGLLRCTKCGIKTKCECGCGTPYVVMHRWAVPVETQEQIKVAAPALDRAIAAIAATPKKSNRRIAAEIGVTERTVRRARQESKSAGGDVAANAAPDRHTGRDGRSYPAKSLSANQPKET